MIRQIRIESYFSFETDLAGAMQDWREFVGGEGYSVELRDRETKEEVYVSYVELEDSFNHVLVHSNSGSGTLFERVLGLVVYLMSGHSDSLQVMRFEEHKTD